MKRLTMILCALLISCSSAPLPPPILPATNSDSARALANAQVGRAATTQAAAHCDAVGQSLLAFSVACYDQIETAANALENDLITITQQQQAREQANAKTLADTKAADAKMLQATKDADAKALTAEQGRTKAAIDAGQSTFVKSMRGLQFIGVIGFAAGIFLFEFCRAQGGVALSQVGEYAAMAFGILFLVALVASLVTTVTAGVAPWLTYCIVAIMVSATVGLIATGFYMLWLHRKTIIEQAKDTAVSMQPTVAFPKPVETVIKALAGPKAALPTPLISVTPSPAA